MASALSPIKYVYFARQRARQRQIEPYIVRVSFVNPTVIRIVISCIHALGGAPGARWS